jgi:hypothetical protein
MKKILYSILALFVINTVMAQPPQSPSVEQRLKKLNDALAKEMTLSAGKQKIINSAFKTFFTKMDKLRGAGETGQPPKKEAVDKLAAERDAQIKKVLSTAEYTKYLLVEQQIRPKPGHQGGPPPPQH